MVKERFTSQMAVIFSWYALRVMAHRNKSYDFRIVILCLTPDLRCIVINRLHLAGSRCFLIQNSRRVIKGLVELGILPPREIIATKRAPILHPAKPEDTPQILAHYPSRRACSKSKTVELIHSRRKCHTVKRLRGKICFRAIASRR